MTPKPHQPKKDSRPKSASAVGKTGAPSNKAAASTGRSGKTARPKGPAPEGTAAASTGGRSGKTARPKGPAPEGTAAASGRRAARGAQAARGAKDPNADKYGRPKKTGAAGKEAGSGRMTAAAGKKAAAAAERDAAKSRRDAGAIPKVVKPSKTSRAQSSAIAAASPGSYLNNCRKRALSVRTRRELGQQPRDVLAQLAIAHPVKTMRLGAIRQLTNGDNARDVAALRQIERAVDAGPEIRAAAARAAEIVQHKVDDL